MKMYFSASLSRVWLCLWLALLAGSAALAQTPAPVRKPLTIATPPKPLPVKWQGADGQDLELRGQLVFSVTRANDDDTLTGWMLYLLPDDQRARLAKHTGQPLKNIPPYLMQTNVAATWAKDTSCPSARIESGELVFEILSGKIHFNRVTLAFAETPDYLPQLFCHWTRQLNTKRQRRSLIAAINRALTGDEPE